MRILGLVYPQQLAGEPEAFEVWKTIKNDFKPCEVVDLTEGAEFVKEVSCRACRDLHLKKALPQLDTCEELYIWAPINTCLIKCLMTYAWLKGKKLWYVSQSIDELEYEDLTPQDYHYTEAATEVK